MGGGDLPRAETLSGMTWVVPEAVTVSSVSPLARGRMDWPSIDRVFGSGVRAGRWTCPVACSGSGDHRTRENARRHRRSASSLIECRSCPNPQAYTPDRDHRWMRARRNRASTRPRSREPNNGRVNSDPAPSMSVPNPSRRRVEEARARAPRTNVPRTRERERHSHNGGPIPWPRAMNFAPLPKHGEGRAPRGDQQYTGEQ